MSNLALTPAEQSRKRVGIGLWGAGVLLGFLIEFYMLILSPVMAGRSGPVVLLVLGAVVAVPACILYMLVPLLIDRFEPEPWSTLSMALFGARSLRAGFRFLSTPS